ncbi:PPE domain-containing protein [Mycobacteroides abscessus]|nr:PPE domain-containing protein [Mycobacteroides abscessus]MDO3331373.1 PPE domain-containing protein [Mycobacteroides abscessus subsp. abscessus]
MALQVDPAALHSTAAALQTVTAGTPPAPAIAASAHPVSIASSAQFNAHAANVSAVLEHAAALAQRAAATYTVSALEFAQSDDRGGVLIANALNAATDAMTSTVTAPIAPAAAAPLPAIPPHPPQPQSIPHPPDPMADPELAEIAAAALRGGDQGASLHAAATTWRARASAVAAYQSTLEQAASRLSQGFTGPAADAALARLRPFAAWFAQAASLTNGVADHAERLAAAHDRVVTDHPTVEQVSTLRQNYQTALSAAATGNAAAAQQAVSYKQQLEEAQNRSTDAIQTYATHSRVPAALPPIPPSPITPGEGDVSGDKPEKGRGKATPREKGKPKTGGDADFDKEPLHAFKPKPGTTAAEQGHAADSEKINQPPAASPLRSPDAAAPLSADTNPAATLGSFPQQAAQMAQGMSPPQAPQAPQVPQMPSAPQVPQMPSTPQGSSPTGGGLPQSTPMSPSGNVPPIAALGGGAGPAGGGGGGGGPSLSSPLGAATPAAALPASTPGASTGSSGPSTGINAGMPMGGMAPPGGSNSGKEKERNADLAPEEAIYIEDRPHTTAFINGTIGPPPPAEDKEQQK